jgi:hypothetical protein
VVAVVLLGQPGVVDPVRAADLPVRRPGPAPADGGRRHHHHRGGVPGAALRIPLRLPRRRGGHGGRLLRPLRRRLRARDQVPQLPAEIDD